MFLGSTSVKAAHKMLVKFIPGKVLPISTRAANRSHGRTNTLCAENRPPCEPEKIKQSNSLMTSQKVRSREPEKNEIKQCMNYVTKVSSCEQEKEESMKSP